MRDDIMLIIVDRFIDDPAFRQDVTANPQSALAEYDLTAEEFAAISDFHAQLGNPTEEDAAASLAAMRRQGVI